MQPENGLEHDNSTGKTKQGQKTAEQIIANKRISLRSHRRETKSVHHESLQT